MKKEYLNQLNKKITNKSAKVSVIGLGYVGFPLSLQIIKTGYTYIGFDINREKIEKYKNGEITINEYNTEKNRNLIQQKNVSFTYEPKDLKDTDIYIICVPTPVDERHNPDLFYIESAAEYISETIKPGNVVIVESTVYTGVTEEVIGKKISIKTNLTQYLDFGLANCPERINPADKKRTIEDIERVIGASSRELAEIIGGFYSSILNAKIHVVSSIKVAEASKIVENTQRDVNIALMNEFALIFERMGLDVMEVIDAASSKWNFIKLKPGAGVGGHCLPHDPHYLANRSSIFGYIPKLILTARKMNDYMPLHMVNLLKKGLEYLEKSLKNSNIIILGAAYKANVDDLRTSPTEVFIKNIIEYKPTLTLVEPCVNEELIFQVKNSTSLTKELLIDVDGFILFTEHDYFKNLDWIELRKYMRNNKVLFIDGRRCFSPEKMEKHYVYITIGRPTNFNNDIKIK